MTRRAVMNRHKLRGSTDFVDCSFLAFLFARRSIACQASRIIWTKPRSPSLSSDIAGNWFDRELEQNFRVTSSAIFNSLSTRLQPGRTLLFTRVRLGILTRVRPGFVTSCERTNSL